MSEKSGSDTAMALICSTLVVMGKVNDVNSVELGVGVEPSVV